MIPPTSCSVRDILDGLDRLQRVGLQLADTRTLVHDLLAHGTEYRTHECELLDGQPLDRATLLDLAAEVIARTATARADLAASDPASRWVVLSYLFAPIHAAGYLVEIIEPGETFGGARARALTAGDGDLDAGVWLLRLQRLQ